MQAVHTTHYKCEKCGEVYATAAEANECEAQPITQDKGVKVGDKVRILNGDGAGEEALVEKVMVYDRSWGHYAWKTYWHTIGLEVKLTQSYGSRGVTFQEYEPIK